MRPLLLLLLLLVSYSASQTCKLTSSDYLGEFYLPDAPVRENSVCDHTPIYNRVQISGRVTGLDCTTPLANAKMEVWHANPYGFHSTGKLYDSDFFQCRATLYTDENGFYNFTTLMPGRYNDEYSENYRYQPAHIHFKITPADEAYDYLATQLFFEKDPYRKGRNNHMRVEDRTDPTLVIPLRHENDYKTFVGTWNVVMQTREEAATVTALQREKKLVKRFVDELDSKQEITYMPNHAPTYAKQRVSEFVDELAGLTEKFNSVMKRMLLYKDAVRNLQKQQHDEL